MNCRRFFFDYKRKGLFYIVLVSLMVLINFSLSLSVAFSNEKDVDAMEINTSSSDLGLASKSYVLMEATTGTILCEKNKDVKVSPASITKIMTLLIIFEELEKGNITLDEEVVTSAYAKSMGGSQVFLEEGEKQSVETLIKCIVIASGNDACVAMAEHISGSETEFVARMNEKANKLGMINTHFEDCCGLSDSDNHYTSAYDVALMSKEITIKYPEIHNYSTIWMENITHITSKGESQFGLANTNKLLKSYPYTTGLKTGSTSKAKYCVAATAKKDDIELIAVVMAAPDYKVRFSEAETLFKYGYGICKLYQDSNVDYCEYIKVKGGVSETVKVMAKETFNYVSIVEEDLGNIEKIIKFNKNVVAPIKKGDVVGKIEYFIGEKNIGAVDIVSCKDVEKASFTNSFWRIFTKYIL